MRVVWKYDVPIEERPCIPMRQGAEILHVDSQHGGIQIWAIIETEQQDVDRYFRVYGTGHDLKDMFGHGKFLGTVVDRTNGFVWHVWTD